LFFSTFLPSSSCFALLKALQYFLAPIAQQMNGREEKKTPIDVHTTIACVLAGFTFAVDPLPILEALPWCSTSQFFSSNKPRLSVILCFFSTPLVLPLSNVNPFELLVIRHHQRIIF
jgi:hypothetical protein